METLLHQEIEVLLSKNDLWPEGIEWEERGTTSDGPARFRKAEAARGKHQKTKQITKQEWINNRITNLDPPKTLRSSKPKTDQSRRDEGDHRATAANCNPCADLGLSSSGDLVEMVDKDCVFDQSPAASEKA